MEFGLLSYCIILEEYGCSVHENVDKGDIKLYRVGKANLKTLICCGSNT